MFTFISVHYFTSTVTSTIRIWFSVETHMRAVLIEHLEPSEQLPCQDGLGHQLNGSRLPFSLSLSVFGIDPSPGYVCEKHICSMFADG